MTRTVYLAGPIFGCTDEQARGWRAAVRDALDHTWRVLDPMDRDYRGREAAHVIDIVGTAMELVYARDYGVRVSAFGTDTPSPWLRYHADVICPTLGDALMALLA